MDTVCRAMAGVRITRRPRGAERAARAQAEERARWSGKAAKDKRRMETMLQDALRNHEARVGEAKARGAYKEPGMLRRVVPGIPAGDAEALHLGRGGDGNEPYHSLRVCGPVWVSLAAGDPSGDDGRRHPVLRMSPGAVMRVRAGFMTISPPGFDELDPPPGPVPPPVEPANATTVKLADVGASFERFWCGYGAILVVDYVEAARVRAVWRSHGYGLARQEEEARADMEFAASDGGCLVIGRRGASEGPAERAAAQLRVSVTSKKGAMVYLHADSRHAPVRFATMEARLEEGARVESIDPMWSYVWAKMNVTLDRTCRFNVCTQPRCVVRFAKRSGGWATWHNRNVLRCTCTSDNCALSERNLVCHVPDGDKRPRTHGND